MVGEHVTKSKIDYKITAKIITDAMKAGSWYWNVQTGYLEINERWAEMAGYTLEELSPISISTWQKLVHPTDFIKSNLELNDVFEGKKDFYNIELRIKHKKGHWIWILDSGEVIERDKNGKPLIAIGTHIDITENKALQLKYKESELFLSQILENTKGIIYRLDLEGNFTYLSKGWEIELGHDVEKTLSFSFEPYVHPDDVELVKNFFEEIKKTQMHQQISGYRLKHRDGLWRYYESNASPIKDGNVVIGYAGIAFDITDKVVIENELINQRKHFEATIMSVGDGIIVTSNCGMISKMNKKAQMLTGYLEKEAIGKDLHQIFSVTRNENDTKLEDIVKRIVETKEGFEIHNITLKNKYGMLIQIDDSVSPILNEKDEVTGVVIVFRDVTEELKKRKQIEYLSYHDQLTDFYNRHYLEESLKELNQIENYPLGIVSIDINNLKEVNDSYGHLMGDKIIKEGSKIIKDNLYRTEYVFRMGGDEFLGIIKNSCEQELEDIKQAIINDISHKCDLGCPLSLSYGFEILYDYSTDIYEGIKIADHKMYLDKERFKKINHKN